MDGGQVIAFECVQFPQDGQGGIGVGNLFEDELHFGLAVHYAYDWVLGVANELLLFELIAGVEGKGPQLRALPQ